MNKENGSKSHRAPVGKSLYRLRIIRPRMLCENTQTSNAKRQTPSNSTQGAAAQSREQHSRHNRQWIGEITQDSIDGEECQLSGPALTCRRRSFISSLHRPMRNTLWAGYRCPSNKLKPGSILIGRSTWRGGIRAFPMRQGISSQPIICSD